MLRPDMLQTYASGSVFSISRRMTKSLRSNAARSANASPPMKSWRIAGQLSRAARPISPGTVGTSRQAITRPPSAATMRSISASRPMPPKIIATP